jgi:hypothetical protein
LINPSIYNPVIDEVKSDLNATDTQIGLSLSMFILYVFSYYLLLKMECVQMANVRLQGGMTVCWSTVADVRPYIPLNIAQN